MELGIQFLSKPAILHSPGQARPCFVWRVLKYLRKFWIFLGFRTNEDRDQTTFLALAFSCEVKFLSYYQDVIRKLSCWAICSQRGCIPNSTTAIKSLHIY